MKRPEDIARTLGYVLAEIGPSYFPIPESLRSGKRLLHIRQTLYVQRDLADQGRAGEKAKFLALGRALVASPETAMGIDWNETVPGPAWVSGPLAGLCISRVAADWLLLALRSGEDPAYWSEWALPRSTVLCLGREEAAALAKAFEVDCALKRRVLFAAGAEPVGSGSVGSNFYNGAAVAERRYKAGQVPRLDGWVPGIFPPLFSEPANSLLEPSRRSTHRLVVPFREPKRKESK